MGTYRRQRVAAHAKVEKERGVLVPVDTARVGGLVAGTRLSTVSRLTGIDRRQLRRLSSGELTKTHLSTLTAIAKWKKTDVRELIGNSSRSPSDNAGFVAEVRARELQAQLARYFPEVAGSERVLSALLSYDAWVTALYSGGIPICEVAEHGGRLLRGNLRRTEKRRVEFAKHLGAALLVLLEPMNQKNSLTPSDRSRVLARALSRLVSTLAQQVKLAHSENNPNQAKEIAAVVERFRKRQLRSNANYNR